ncbi:MAG: AbrB/MazE/SpoVT family DNA-binding domain-containing protein [Euryarchaeota archaeon]|nr:AbrB/MazE/SpoVT family DNA-binding domain-containing protein [Euryarchaeota archaeon]
MRGWKCKKCGNELADPRDAQRILEIKKAVSKGATVGKVGKSLAIRIPKSLVTFYNIKPGNKIKLAPKAKEISILVGD